ncbi:MAG: hypothetical protein J0I77_02845 [Rudaea sp.]|uniref:DUF2007 domain-containing protein n=1 Tax=marine sediment metagenome TaxID=412755 RepID=X1EPF1_9ZZZZ|nr:MULTISPECIES: hypothetical protein [unclassified Rudaea]MBN8884636.1 hypothetical protein [Rudaea sp.]
MRRAYWTLDWYDAHIVAQMLHHEGIDAWVFNDNIVRTDWMQAIAYGGYRVMIDDGELADAQKHIDDYLHGKRRLAAADDDLDLCPNCGGHAVRDNAVPRRLLFIWFFLSFLSVPVFVAIAVAHYASSLSHIDIVGTVALSTAVFFLLTAVLPPLYSAFRLKWQYRCDNCAHRWQSPPQERWSILRDRASGA